MGTAKITPKHSTPIVDNRHLKIIAAKKDDLKDAVVFVCLNEEKYGLYDLALLRKAVEEIDKIEPRGTYFSAVKDYEVSIYDRHATKNKDIVITVGHNAISEKVSESDIEDQFKQAFSHARSVTVVHHHAEAIETSTSP